MLILRLITDQLLTYRTQYLTTEFEFPRKSRRDIIFKIISAVFYTFSVFNLPRFLISASDTQLPWFTFLEFVMKSYKEFSNYSNSKQIRKFFFVNCLHVKTNKQPFNSFLEKPFQPNWHDVNHFNILLAEYLLLY